MAEHGNRRPTGRRPVYRLNPVRQAIFVALALIGLGVGYGIGYLTNGQPSPAPQGRVATVDNGGASAPKFAIAPAPAPAATATPSAGAPLLPEIGKATEGSRVRAYEEALPKNIIEPRAAPAEPEKPTSSAPPPEAVKKPPEAAAPPPEPAKSAPEPASVTVERPTAPQRQAALPPKEEASKTPAIAPPLAAVGRLPAWKRFAVVVPAAAGRPRIAIVIDDLGIDKPRTARVIHLRPPLTLSFLTYASGLKKLTAEARAAGHELMMHIPMEPSSLDVDPGPNVLLTGIPRDELLASLKWNLQQFDGYVGVNNHMGSRFTADLPGMMVVMEELKKRDLLFLDSITAGNSVAGKAARRVGVPFARRNVFLDDEDNVATIRKQLAEVERLARRTGTAVAIGHPREATLQALVPWLAGIESKGFQLVPVSAIVRPPASRG